MLPLQTVLFPDPDVAAMVPPVLALLLALLVVLLLLVRLALLRLVDVDVRVDGLGLLLGLLDGVDGLLREVFEVLDGGVEVADEAFAPVPWSRASVNGSRKGKGVTDLEREKSSRTTTRRSLSVPALGAIVYAGRMMPLRTIRISALVRGVRQTHAPKSHRPRNSELVVVLLLGQLPSHKRQAFALSLAQDGKLVVGEAGNGGSEKVGGLGDVGHDAGVAGATEADELVVLTKDYGSSPLSYQPLMSWLDGGICHLGRRSC